MYHVVSTVRRIIIRTERRRVVTFSPRRQCQNLDVGQVSRVALFPLSRSHFDVSSSTRTDRCLATPRHSNRGSERLVVLPLPPPALVLGTEDTRPSFDCRRRLAHSARSEFDSSSNSTKMADMSLEEREALADLPRSKLFKGLVFVFHGPIPGYTSSKLTKLIKNHGGKVMDDIKGNAEVSHVILSGQVCQSRSLFLFRPASSS